MRYTLKMTSSLTVAFTGTSSVLQSSFLPQITLDGDCKYSCALLNFIVKNCEKLAEIVKLGEMRINCDIISDSYINGSQSHTIHQFASSASYAKGQTFVEIPKHLIYFPVKTKYLTAIQISIVDHKGRLVNIYGGEIICRIHIKRDSN